MNEAATTPTWNLLRSLGFQPDSAMASQLNLDVGDLQLSAVEAWSPGHGQGVYFTGVFSGPRTMAEIDFALPLRMGSLKQCAAWIVWNLDQYCGGLFKEACRLTWVLEARQSRTLLPWVQSMGEYKTRPHCVVQRDWLLLALKTLRQQLSSLPDQTPILFSFDGSVLFIRCSEKVIVLPGEGTPWTVRFKVLAQELRCMPKRLKRERVEVSISRSQISLGTWVCKGIIEQGEARPVAVQ